MVKGVTLCLSSRVYSVMVSDGLPGHDTGPSGGGNSGVCVSGVALIPFIAELMEHEKCKLYPIPPINNIQTHSSRDSLTGSALFTAQATEQLLEFVLSAETHSSPEVAH